MSSISTKKRRFGNVQQTSPAMALQDGENINSAYDDENKATSMTGMSSSSKRYRPNSNTSSAGKIITSVTPTTTALSAAAATTRTIYKYQDTSLIQGELDHERSLRSLDRKRFEQIQNRLERQVQFAMEEADLNKNLLEELREASETHIQQLRQQLREKSAALEAATENQMQSDHDNNNNDSKHALFERKCMLLQEEVERRKRQEQVLQQQIKQLQQSNSSSSRNETGIINENAFGTPQKQQQLSTEDAPSPSSSPAPKAVLKELNRVRIQLSESERKQRQLLRTIENNQNKIASLIQYEEKAKNSYNRISKLEYELHQVNQQKQVLDIQNQQWKQLGQSIHKLLPATSSGSKKDDNNMDIPPEFSSLVRHLGTLNNRIQQLQETNEVLQGRIDKLKATVEGEGGVSVDEKIKEHNKKEQTWLQQQKDYEQKIKLLQQDMETLKAQENVYKRETEQLRVVLKTLDDDNPSNTGNTSGTATIKGLEIKIQSMDEDIKVLTKDRDRLSKELKSSMEQTQSSNKEIERIKEKFIKLREALNNEKIKVEKAESRAIRAEELAGQGSFNPKTTKVLSLRANNPLTDALKEEIKVLKRQIDVLKKAANNSNNTGDNNDNSNNVVIADPDKLHQRLKQSFKEQIALFREGVHLMTGYKIDMISAGAEGSDNDRPTFRVRSMYAENEHDHLMLKWPKQDPKKMHIPVSSLDVLNTDFAQQLTTTPVYDYMTKYHSLPAFLAGVQLHLFEKQTIML